MAFDLLMCEGVNVMPLVMRKELLSIFSLHFRVRAAFAKSGRGEVLEAVESVPRVSSCSPSTEGRLRPCCAALGPLSASESEYQPNTPAEALPRDLRAGETQRPPETPADEFSSIKAAVAPFDPASIGPRGGVC